MARHDDDDDAFDEFGVLRDGRSVRVSMQMRDAAMADGEARDAAQRFGLSDAMDMHRPGQRLCTDAAARNAVEQARAEGIKEDENAWRTPAANSETGFGSSEFRGARPGDQCTINGAPGHLNHRLECVPDKRSQDSASSVPRTMDAATAQRIRDQAYEESLRREQDEWRSAR